MRESSLWTLVVVFLAVAILLPATNVAFEDATTTMTQVNESVTVDYAGTSSLDPGEAVLSFEPNATVFNASGVELTNGTDYNYHPHNGSLTWIDTANTVDGESATVTYDYVVRAQHAKDAEGPLTIVAQAAGWLLLFAGIGAVFRYGTGW